MENNNNNQHSGQAPRGRESGGGEGRDERLGLHGGKTLKKYKDSLRLIYRVYAKQMSLYSICEGPTKFNYYYYLSKSLSNANLQTIGNVNL